MKSTFRILFYLKKGNPKKNGKFAIMARITIDGKMAQFSTKIEVLPSEWEVKSGKVKGNSARSINLNRELDSLRVKASEHYDKQSAKRMGVSELHRALRKKKRKRRYHLHRVRTLLARR